MVRVAEVQTSDAADVGAHGNLIVGDALGSPDTAHLLGTFALHLKNPYLIRVGNGQAFSGVAVAIFLDELSHQSDGLSRCGTAFQCHARQFLYHKQSRFVLQGVASAVGRLADTQLVLVQTGIGGVEVAVGVACLRYLSALLHSRSVGGVLRVIVLGWYDAHPRAIP